MGPESPPPAPRYGVPRGGYRGADCMLMSGLLLPAEALIVMLGGARARFVLRAFVDSVLGVRFEVAGVEGVALEFLENWFRRWSIRACCWARIESASMSCKRVSGFVVALGGRPGERIARPTFLVEEPRSIGAGRLRASGEVDSVGGGGEVGSCLIFLL